VSDQIIWDDEVAWDDDPGPKKAKPEDLGIKSARDLWRLASSPFAAASGAYDWATDTSRMAQQVFARPLAKVGEWVEPKKLSSLITGSNDTVLGAWSRALDAEQKAAEAKRPKDPPFEYEVGKFGGELAASTLPFLRLLKGAEAGIPALNTLRSGATLTPRSQATREAFAGGTGLGATMPSSSSEEQATNAAFGAVLSSAAQKGTQVVGDKIVAPVKSTLNKAAKQAVEFAKEHGFDLSPGQQSGNPIQQLIESVFRTLPSTSKRETERHAANQQLLQNKVEALDPRMPQVDAGRAAVEGYQAGLAKEEATLAKAYDDLLTGKDINYEGARGPMEVSKRAAARQAPSNRGGQAYDELGEWLGDPNYAKKAAPAWVPKPVDASKDDIVTAVRKLGGIDPTDPRVGTPVVTGLPFTPHPQHGPVWSKQQFGGSANRSNTTRGHSLESMAQKLHQEGYIDSPDALDDILDKLADSFGGGKQHYSTYFDHAAANPDPLAGAIEALTAKLEGKNAPKPPRAGHIREAGDGTGIVEGRVAQRERSEFTTKASKAAESSNAKAQIYRDMRGAIDIAIEKSLPQAERGQFAAINKRWGIYEALERMTPENQATFIKSLYAGTSGSPDRFYTFLGLAPPGEFAKVAKGFLSDLVEKSTKGGNVSGKALERVTDAADPDAMKIFGGEPGRQLWQLGQVGGKVLPDAVPNSGTAQRMFIQGLLTGGVGGGADFFTGGEDASIAGSLLKGAGIGVGSLALPRLAQSAYYAGAKADKKALADQVRRIGPTWARALGLQADFTPEEEAKQ